MTKKAFLDSWLALKENKFQYPSDANETIVDYAN